MRTNLTLSTHQTLYPGSVHSVSLAQNLDILTQLIDERMEALRELERHLYMYHGDGKRRTLKIVRGGREESVEAIKHYRRLVIELSMQISKEQKEHEKYSSVRGNVSSDEAVRIENLLRVTGMGVVKRLIAKSHAGDEEAEASPSDAASLGGSSIGSSTVVATGYGSTEDKSIQSLDGRSEDDGTLSLLRVG